MKTAHSLSRKLIFINICVAVLLSLVIVVVLPGIASADLVNISGTSLYYPLIQDAYNAANDTDAIRARDVTFSENLIFARPISVTLEGGYASDFSTLTGVTVVNGNMTVSSGTVTIGNIILGTNVAPPTVQWTAASQASANESGTMIVTAQLSAASEIDVTVPYTVTGTATGGGTDYTITASPITITAGSTTGTATITIAGDTLSEGNETVILTMGTPVNAALGATAAHTATITDDDIQPVLLSTFGRGSYRTEGELNFPSGITTDSVGNVYVCTDANASISKFDSEGNFIRRWTMKDCFGLEADANNNIYVAVKLQHKIAKYDSNGTLLGETGSYGQGDGQFYEPNDVAINHNLNRLYVADSRNLRVQVFDISGNNFDFLFKWGEEGNGDGEFSGTRGPLGIAIDQMDGSVYVADSDGRRMQKFDMDGNFILEWGGDGTEEGKFRWPRNVDVDGNGKVYVSDTDNERIEVFDSAGIFLWQIQGKPGTDKYNTVCFEHDFHTDCTTLHNATDGPFHPRDVTVDSENNFVYAAATYAQRIDKFTISGEFIYTWGWWEKDNGVFNTPTGLAIDTTRGYVYVADMNNFLIQKFDNNGTFITSWGYSSSVNKSEGGDGSFNFPESLTVDINGNVYVIRPQASYPGDVPFRRINKFDSNGILLTGWNYVENPDYGQLHAHVLRGIVYNPFNGYIYISNTNKSYGQYKLIQYFDTEGNFIDEFGEYGNGDGQLNYPTKMAVDRHNGDIYVVDLGNSRIKKFDKEGNFILKFGSYGAGDYKFKLDIYSGIHVDDKGYVYISDTGNQKIKVFNSDGVFKKGLSVGGLPAGIGLDSDRYLYVVNRNNNKIDKYMPIEID